MKVKSESEVTQSCPTPSDPMDCSLPDSSIHGIFQVRVLTFTKHQNRLVHFATASEEKTKTKEKKKERKEGRGPSLAVQWLTLCLPMQGA